MFSVDIDKKTHDSLIKLFDNACAVVSFYDADEIPDPCIIEGIREALTELDIEIEDGEAIEDTD